MSTRHLAIVALGTLALTGCANDYAIDFEQITSPIGYASIEFHEIRIDEATGVGVVANPIDDDGERLDLETPVDLVAENGSVLGIARIEFDQDVEDERTERQQRGDWRFVIYGKSQGNTVVNVWIDDELHGEIPAVVDEPLP